MAGEWISLYLMKCYMQVSAGEPYRYVRTVVYVYNIWLLATLLQALFTTVVLLHWNTTLGVSQSITLGYKAYYRSKLSIKRQLGGVNTLFFPPNTSFGEISSLEPSYAYYEFSVQVVLNISGQPTVNQPQSFSSTSALMVLTPGRKYFPS